MGKAQVSVEVLLIIGFALIALVPILLLLRNQSSVIGEQQGVLEADLAAQRIAENADIVASMGNNATIQTKLLLPSSVQSIKIGETHPREIVFTLLTSRGTVEIVKTTNANVTGTLDIRGGGNYVVKITSISTTSPLVSVTIS
ncbi:hypothetical protein HY570_00995 [Candidatus Micrarchaeota archaeon]|nr:hypothetical protein [Candidatus Micrarchaeota archaeon]